MVTLKKQAVKLEQAQKVVTEYHNSVDLIIQVLQNLSFQDHSIFERLKR